MARKLPDTWVAAVETALKQYRRADELPHNPALSWPAVLERRKLGVSGPQATRQVIDQAIADLRRNFPTEAALLRERYVHGRSIEGLAGDTYTAPSSLHRHRNRSIAELAAVIAEANRKAERRVRHERFAVRHPVVGLSSLVESLVNELRNPTSPAVLVLEGMGGLGKTTLAQLIAREFVDDDTFARVLWVSAKQVDFDVWAGKQRLVNQLPISTQMLVRDLAKELAIDIHFPLPALQAEVVARCAQRPYLIVFDNLETVADLQSLLPLIQAIAGHSRIVVTTRDHTVDVLPADMPRCYVALPELDEQQSFKVLRNAATYTGAPALAQASDVELAAIWSVTGGNPLALWLVAGQAHGVPWTNFVGDLVSHAPRGSKGYALYDYLYRRSWELLSRPARVVLFALHRCELGASYDLLYNLSALDKSIFDQALAEVVDRMLLTFDGATYTIHRLTYSFLRVGVVQWWK